jgi:hypothetical protein
MLLLALAGCGPKTPTPVVPEPRDECRLSANSADRPDTFTVALPDSVHLAHAPIPTNDSEQFLFRQLFETLVRLDCRGVVRPGLAVGWQSDETGRRWTFTLRSGGSPPDRTAAVARVVSSWQAHPDILQAIGIDSALPLDDRRLAVTLRAPADSVPHLFAEPALALSDARDSSLGPATRFLVLRPHQQPGVLDFRVEPGGDPRDALDRGADLVVTRDPALVDYAAQRPEFSTFSLPWSRTYVLLEPPGTQPVLEMIAADSVRRSLARDAVRAEARPAEPPYWWNSLAACRSGPSNGEGLTSSRVVYPRGDAAARGLAERIVALAQEQPPLRVAALGPANLAAALRDGTERAYVLAVARQTLVPCREAALWPPGASIQPLIDTRASAILRRGSPTLAVEWDGTVRVLGDDEDSPEP